jgi:alpha-L-rhamnosidase
MHTAAPSTMTFGTDVPMLNRLHSNITWGQRGNFVSIPTDTPARDERLGWTGDINVFAGTAAYTMESARFLGKWTTDMRDAQWPDGAFPDFAPHVDFPGRGTAGWGDAGVTVPWTLYERYADRRLLEAGYPAMTRWISYLERNSNNHLRPDAGYGDWLNVGDETRKDLIGTAHFAHTAALVAATARVLGRRDDAARYESLAANVREAFVGAYVTADGRLKDEPPFKKGDTQTGYVLALSMRLLPDSLRKPAADRLVELIRQRDWHLSTGFLGTPRLLPILTETGHIDVAYRLLHQTGFPSWGYQIERGATTMWERWDSIKPDGGFQDPAMNSFNHYAYGSVGEWMHQNIAGISPGAPGFSRILIRPRPGGQVRAAHGSHTTVHGRIDSRWRIQNNRFTLEITIPVNTTAQVWIPATAADAVTEGRGPARTAEGVRFEGNQDGHTVFTVGSGRYRFTTRYDPPAPAPRTVGDPPSSGP